LNDNLRKCQMRANKIGECVVYILNNIYDTAGNKLFYLPAAPV